MPLPMRCQRCLLLPPLLVVLSLLWCCPVIVGEVEEESGTDRCIRGDDSSAQGVRAARCTRNDVTISLATIPGREEQLRATLESLLLQTVEAPIVVVAQAHLKYPATAYTVPGWLEDMQGVRVLRCPPRGPASKLLCPLEEGGLDDDIIITVDDDCVYHPRMIEQLLSYSEIYPDAALAYAGHRIADHPLEMPNLWYVRLPHHMRRTGISVPQPIRIDVVHGYMGVLYRRGFLRPQELLDYGDLREEAVWIDDQWVSGCMARHGVPIMAVPSPEPLVHHLEVPDDTALTTPARQAWIIKSEGKLLRRFVEQGWMALRPAGFVQKKELDSLYARFGDPCWYFIGGHRSDAMHGVGGRGRLVSGLEEAGGLVSQSVAIAFPVHGSLIRCAPEEREIEIWLQNRDDIDTGRIHVLFDPFDLSIESSRAFIGSAAVHVGVNIGHGIWAMTLKIPCHEHSAQGFVMSVTIDDQVIDTVTFAYEPNAPGLSQGCERYSLVVPDVWATQSEGYTSAEQGRDGVEGVALRFALELNARDMIVAQEGQGCGGVGGLLSREGGMQVVTWPPIEQQGEEATAGTVECAALSLDQVVNVDVFSVADAGGQDWHVVHSMLSSWGARPRLVVAELNAWIPLDEDWVVKRDSPHLLLGEAYYGAGLKAWLLLARKHGYSLVHVDSGGRAVFMLRDDVLELLQGVPTFVNDVEGLFSLVTYRHCCGGVDAWDWDSAERKLAEVA